MTSLDIERRSNGYSKRRFWMGCYSQSTSSFGTLSPASGVYGSIVWCPVTKKYYSGELDGTGATVYSRTPGGLWTLVHTGSGNGVGLFWSRRLGMLVYFTSTHIYTSVDGATWVSRTVPASYAPTSMTSFCDANTYSVFFEENASDSYLLKTVDGVTWTRNAVGWLTAASVGRCGAISGSDTVVFGYEDNNNGCLRYTVNGTTSTSIVNNSAMHGYFPPTPLRPEHWYVVSTTAYRSVDGVNFSDAACGLRSTTFSINRSFCFGGVMSSNLSTNPQGFDFLNYGEANKKFSDVYTDTLHPGLNATTQISVQGEFLSQIYQSTGWNPRPVGAWLEPGDYMCILIGGGGQNVSTTIGGCAGAMVRHKFTVTEKHRWIAYNIAGATAIVDVGGSDGLQRDVFLAYASFAAYSAQPGPNQACFGDEVYYGMPAIGRAGAACGPSGGGSAYRAIGKASGCGSEATTTATTPNDWWDPEDWVGNPSGTGYPGTSGNTAGTIGLLAGSTDSGVYGSFGSGGCNTSTAFAQRGGEPLIIIYSN